MIDSGFFLRLRYDGPQYFWGLCAMHEGDLEISFVETIRDSDLSDSALELLDDVLGDSPVPVLSTLWRFWKGARTVHNYFYVKKVVGFLTELGTMPKETRKAQVNKMLIVPGESEKFGEHIATSFGPDERPRKGPPDGADRNGLSPGKDCDR